MPEGHLSRCGSVNLVVSEQRGESLPRLEKRSPHVLKSEWLSRGGRSAGAGLAAAQACPTQYKLRPEDLLSSCGSLVVAYFHTELAQRLCVDCHLL